MELAYIAVLEAATERYRSSTLLSPTKILNALLAQQEEQGTFNNRSAIWKHIVENIANSVKAKFYNMPMPSKEYIIYSMCRDVTR